MMAVGPVDSFISSVCEKRMDPCLEAGKRMDIADIIKTALTVSNKFGVASYKATLAWKSIEEIEYAEDKKERTNENSQLTDVLGIEEYEGMLNELKPLLNKQETKTEKMKSLANQIKVSPQILLESLYYVILLGPNCWQQIQHCTENFLEHEGKQRK